MASPESPRTWVPTYSALEETVLTRRYDRWSFVLALLAAAIGIFFLGEPIACVSPAEATIPMQCKALEDYQKQGANVRLRSFCYRSCSDASSNIYTYAMIFGLLLHALGTLPDICGCRGFMRITCSCNYSSLSEWWNDSNLGRFVQYGTEWLHKALEEIRRINSRRLTVQMRFIHKTAVTLYLLAFVEFSLHTVSSLHLRHHGVSFACTGLSGQQISSFSSVTHRPLPSCGRALVLSLLLLSAWLGQKARFGFSFRCTLVDLEKAVPGHEPGQLCRWTEHEMLSQVIGKQLKSFRILPESVNEEDQEQQTASSQEQFVDVTFEQPDASEEESRRGWVLIVAAFAMILLHSASTSCWASINQMHLEESEGNLFAIQAKLLLLGSSGRRKGSGVLCWLGALCMLLVAFAQWLVMAARKETDPEKEMRLTYMIRGESESTNPRRQSHVWLRQSLLPVGNGSWEPADFSVRDRDDRSKWRRSQKLKSVTVCSVDGQSLYEDSEGLPTEQQGESDTYITFERDDDRRTVTQVVPLHFLDDTAYVSLNVGSQMAWDNFAIFASIVASLLALIDLMFHLIYYAQGQLLLNCGDIFSEGCLMLDNELDNSVSAQVPASSAIGVFFALLGSVVASSTVIMLAKVKRTRPPSISGFA